MKNVNIFAQMPQDVLHQDYMGLGGVHLLNCVFADLARTLDSAQEVHSKGIIKARLQYLRQVHGTNIPSQGLETKNITGEASQCTCVTGTDAMFVCKLDQCVWL